MVERVAREIEAALERPVVETEAIKRVPICRFRWKGTQLQQAFRTTGGSRVFWANVPTVSGDASDVG